MKKFIKVLFIVMVLVLVSAGFIGCKKSNEKLIVTSIYPITWLTKQVVGDKFEVKQLITGDAHDYKLTAEDALLIDKATSVLYLNEDFEVEIAKYLDSNNMIDKDEELVEDDDLIKSEKEHEHGEGSKHHHHSLDPHVWTSPKRLVKILDDIYEEVIKYDVANKEFYKNNYLTLRDKLVKMDTKYKEELTKKFKSFLEKDNSYSNMKVFVTHEAFAYLEEDYSIDSKKILEIEGLHVHDHEPTVELVNLANEIHKNNSHYICYTMDIDKEKDQANTVVDEIKKKDSSYQINTIKLSTMLEYSQEEDLLKLLDDQLKTILKVAV